MSLAIVLITKQLPVFLFAPIAGPMADRFKRRNILYLMDIIRAILASVLLFIPISSSPLNQGALVYAIVFLQSVASAFFEPSRAAMTPEIVDPQDLTAANALTSMVWSLSLIVGSALGGIVTEQFGWKIAVVVDAVSFLVSGYFILKIRYDSAPQSHAQRASRGLGELWRYFDSAPGVFQTALVKFACGFGGAAYLLLSVLGQRVFTVGAKGVLGISLLYSARAIGALLGPFVGRYFSGSDESKMRDTVLVGLFMYSAAYALLGVAVGWPEALICVAMGHFGGSLMWGFSTVLIQMSVPNELRGRVFGFEIGLATISNSLSLLFCGFLMDQYQVSPQQASLAMGLTLFATVAWWWAVVKRYFGRTKSNVN